MVAPNFLCYGNAYFMPPDRFSTIHQKAFFFHWSVLFFLLSCLFSAAAERSAVLPDGFFVMLVTPPIS
jgi:hypothetical protein